MRSKKPPQQAVKRLTVALCKTMPRKKGKVVLDKTFFTTELYSALYKIHDDMVDREGF